MFCFVQIFCMSHIRKHAKYFLTLHEIHRGDKKRGDDEADCQIQISVWPIAGQRNSVKDKGVMPAQFGARKFKEKALSL